MLSMLTLYSPNTLTLKNFGEGLGVDRLKPVLQTKAHGGYEQRQADRLQRRLPLWWQSVSPQQRFIAAGYRARNIQMGIVWRRDNQRVGIGTAQLLYRSINFQCILLAVFCNQLRRVSMLLVAGS